MTPRELVKLLFAGAALAIVLLSGSAIAATTQSAAPAAPEAPENEVEPVIRDVTRFDAWSFFEPRSPDADPDYLLLGNRATLGVRLDKPRFRVFGAFQYAQLVGLPRRATGPGPLGPGALYYDAARTPEAYQLYFKALSIRVKKFFAPSVSIEAGRMGASPDSGHEKRVRTPRLIDESRNRLAGRLIGEVGWSIFERAFDGVRLDVDREGWDATAALLWPTQGAFEESANPTLDEVRVAAASLQIARDLTPSIDFHTVTAAGAGSPDAHELQFFAYHYSDRRQITSRPDNTGRPSIAADIGIATVGASHIGSYAAGRGQAESLLWAAGQLGDWYGADHRAFSLVAEGGYRWRVRWEPWLRAGLTYASGDRDPADGEHGTFFPMLPSTKPDLLAGTFAQMNLRDLFAEVRLHPHHRLRVSGDVHELSLLHGSDRWYSGTGATASTGSFFGFVTRRPGGSTDLGWATTARAEIGVTTRWRLSASLGTVKGGDVVRQLFAGDRLTVFSLESVLAFD